MDRNNPQLEDGYIRIAVDLWEALGRYRLSGEEWLVLNCIIRKTYGWQKKKDRISLQQISNYTNINRPNVARTIKSLLNKGVIKKDNSYINLYSLNKTISEWKVLSKKITAKKVLSKMITGVINNDNKSVINIDTHKRYKDTITKDIHTMASPEIKNVFSVGDIALKKTGISTAWQDKAFRYASSLKIKLEDPGLKSRWLKFFKTGIQNKIDRAYTYLSDYPPFIALETDEARIKYFFGFYFKNK